MHGRQIPADRSSTVVFLFSFFEERSSCRTSNDIPAYTTRCQALSRLIPVYIYDFFDENGMELQLLHVLQYRHEECRQSELQIDCYTMGRNVVVGHHIQQIDLQSCLWSLNREKNEFSRPRSRLGNLVSRDGFSRPVPRQPAHSPRPG